MREYTVLARSEAFLYNGTVNHRSHLVEPSLETGKAAIGRGRQRERTARVAVVAVGPTLAVTAYSALTSNSLALFADLVLTILDSACVLVAWLVARQVISERPARNYDARKLESLAGVAIGMVMIASLCLVVALAALRLWRGGAVVEGQGILAGLAGNLIYGLINGGILQRYRAQRRVDQSPLVQSQIRLFVDKVTANLVMAAALGAAVLFRDAAIGPYIDPVASLVVALSMAFWSTQIIRSSVSELTDAECGEEVRRPVMAALARHAGTFGDLQAIRTRRASGMVHVEIELGFAPDVTVTAVERLRADLADFLRRLIPELSLNILPRPSATPNTIAKPRNLAVCASCLIVLHNSGLRDGVSPWGRRDCAFVRHGFPGPPAQVWRALSSVAMGLGLKRQARFTHASVWLPQPEPRRPNILQASDHSSTASLRRPTGLGQPKSGSGPQGIRNPSV
ncbi:cation transporter [Inquilinus limosus]|uniref:cation diffusion facilitator family transporter n=1 Tax=Inquilinus limosus TaxID=171674 RepID=UPI003F1366D6